MGEENKLLLPYRGKTILETTIQNLLESEIGELIVVIGHDLDKVGQVLASYDVTVVINDNYESGQVSSVKKGLLSIQDNEKTPFMIALADMPLITKTGYNLLITRFLHLNSEEKVILRPRSKCGQPGNPVLFDSSFKEALLNNEAREKTKHILNNQKASLKYLDTDIPSFFKDVDTKADYRKSFTY